MKNIIFSLYFQFKNREEAKLMVEDLNSKIRELLNDFSKLDILPVRVDITLRQGIYETLQEHNNKKNKKHSYTAVVDVEMDYYVIYKAFDKEEEAKDTQEVLESLHKLQKSQKLLQLDKTACNLYGNNLPEQYNSGERFTISSNCSRNVRLTARDTFLDQIRQETDFKKSPHYQFTLDIHSLLNDGKNYNLIGQIHKTSYQSKELENGYDIR